MPNILVVSLISLNKMIQMMINMSKVALAGMNSTAISTKQIHILEKEVEKKVQNQIKENLRKKLKPKKLKRNKKNFRKRKKV